MGREIKILYCSYRDWAKQILYNIKNEVKNCDFKASFIHIENDEQLKNVDIKKYDLIFFIGWSTIIPERIVKSIPCICLHPSPLPKYRGGSPLQHQILNGENESAVTLFLMDSGIDTGDILRQVPFSLEGDMEEIFTRISNISYYPILSIIDEYIKNGHFISKIKQSNEQATFFKRRKKEMSEIYSEDFLKYTASELYNKIRSLQDPYPNAFIRCKDDTVLYITKAKAGVIK